MKFWNLCMTLRGYFSALLAVVLRLIYILKIREREREREKEESSVHSIAYCHGHSWSSVFRLEQHVLGDQSALVLLHLSFSLVLSSL